MATSRSGRQAAGRGCSEAQQDVGARAEPRGRQELPEGKRPTTSGAQPEGTLAFQQKH